MELIEKCGPTLTSISLAGCVYLTDRSMKKISQCCSAALQK